MIRTLIVFLLFLGIFTASAQHTKTTANTNGTGWRKVAYIDSPNKRGFGKISIIVPGGALEPRYSDIYWFSDWGNNYTLNTETLSPDWQYWSSIRITDDANQAYIEVNFTVSIPNLTILSDSYGFYPAKPYTGNLPVGGGTFRVSIRNGRLNIANQFIVNNNGNVGIGTTSLMTAKLAVNGDIRAKEVKVEAANWPDYVFRQDYELMPLKEVEQHIKQHGHLPDVPKAARIEEEGLSLGEMNKLMMKKIEELTLHLIEKDREIQDLKLVQGSIVDLQKRLQNLEKK